MAAGRLNRYWTLTIILLVVVIIVGGIAAWSRYNPEHPVEISLPQEEEWHGSIYIGGAVTNPGIYSFSGEDSIETLIQAAGGITDGANLSEIEVRIPEVGDGQEAQKININRAEAWLLEALPDIGPTLAQRIVDYREQNGLFSNTSEITRITGIGDAIYEKIKDLITVAD
ncbi:helix-hairpin-helix domain-containing protein [Chloroflexota bacterium]